MVKNKKNSITINVSRKDIYLFSAIFIFLIGVGAIIAYGGNSPTIVGHSASEISGMIVGGCSVACDQGSSTFANCAGSWGSGVCSTSGSACKSGHCSCSMGTLTYIANDQSWSSKYAFDTMRLQYLCINP